MEVDDGDHLALLSEQRRELTAAIAADSDLDFAFQLQMQEAITVSLTSQPSSSSSCSQQPALLLNDVVESPSGVAHLLAEEIDKFEQERSDRAIVEAETMKMRENLNRLMHDQVFARQILEVPDDEWRKTGDYIEMPYGVGSSTDAEVFRVYFKGLVRQETVAKAKMIFAGIGVAIYDTGDRCVFELRKPFLFGGDDGADGDVVELNALLEALNAVVALGLRTVDIFCDSRSIYRYVENKPLLQEEWEEDPEEERPKKKKKALNRNGPLKIDSDNNLITSKWRPTQGKILTLVDQLSLLQKKIANLRSSFVTQDKIQYAYELARDAILFQASQHSESLAAKKLTETCAICLEDIYSAQMFFVNDCLHRYCFSCLRKHTEAKLHQGKLPDCPHEGCKSDLKIENSKKFLTPELYNIMSLRIKEDSIPAREKIYCPFSSCSTLMSKAEVQDYAATLSTANRQSGARKCLKCQRLFCINCKVPWHGNMTCFDYKMRNPYPDANEAKLKSLATRKHWRQCINCDNMVELAKGCNHIYCRCGYEFCYSCGAAWHNKKPTCNCPLWDERYIINPNHRR